MFMNILSEIYLWTIFRKLSGSGVLSRIQTPDPDAGPGADLPFALALRLFAHFPRLFPRGIL